MRIDLNFRFFGYAIRFSMAPASICEDVADAPEQDDEPTEAAPTPDDAPVAEAAPATAPAPTRGKPGRKEGWRERQAAKRATEAVNALLAEAPVTVEPVTVEPAVNEAEERAKRIHEARLANLVFARAVKAEKEAKRAAAREKRAAKRAAAKAMA